MITPVRSVWEQRLAQGRRPLLHLRHEALELRLLPDWAQVGIVHEQRVAGKPGV
jgi:hypothetical protein